MFKSNLFRKSCLVTVIVTLTTVIFLLISQNSGKSATVHKDENKKNEQNLNSSENTRPQALVTQIDGEKNPELISDEAAYTVVFRFIGSYKNDKEKRSLSNYIEQNLDIKDREDIEKMFQLAEQFKQAMKPVDVVIDTIKERYTSFNGQFNAEDLSKLNAMKVEKDRIAKDFIHKTSKLLKQSNKEKLDKAMKERVKTKMKIKAPQ